MDSSSLPDPDEHEWDFEKHGSIGVWYMEGWQGFADESLEAASNHYRERAKRADINGTVAVFGEQTTLSQETQEYMGEEWSENGEYTGVDRIAFASDGITAMAVKSQMEIPSAEIEDFDDVDTAIEWAQD